MLPYPPDHEITVEELRELVYDDMDGAYLFEDDRYEVWIDRYPDNWRMAAIAAADRVLMHFASRPNRLSSDGDSIGWSDQRIAILRDKYAALLADLEEGEYGQIVTVIGNALTPSLTHGSAEWS